MAKIILPTKQFVASMDVDCQRCFTTACPDELPVPNAEKIVPELNAQASKARLRVASKDAHSPHAIWVANAEQAAFSKLPHEDADTVWPQHAVPGTLGFELISGLPPIKQYNYFVWKGIETNLHPYGACYHDLKETLTTGLIEFLRANKIQTVIVGGLILELCVKVTALQLRRAQFNVIVNLGATCALTTEAAQQAQQALQANGVQFVESCAELVNTYTTPT